ALNKSLHIMLAFAIALILYRLFLIFGNIDITDNRMKMTISDSGFTTSLLLKWNMFYEHLSLLMNTKGYKYLLYGFLLLPFLALLYKNRKHKFTLISTFILYASTVFLVLITILLIPGANLLLKTTYLPLRALPSLGVALLVLLS